MAQKWPKIIQKSPKIAQIGPKMTQNCPKISTSWKKIAQIYLQDLQLFASLTGELVPKDEMSLIIYIPDICHCSYNQAFWGLLILHPKVRKY